MEVQQRDDAIKKLVAQGVSLAIIGRAFDISRERVRQLCPNTSNNGRRPLVDHNLQPDFDKIMLVLDTGEYRSWAEVGRKVGLDAARVRKVLRLKLGDEKVRELSNRLQLDSAKAIVQEFLDYHPSGLITFSNLSRVVGYSSASYVNRRKAMSEWRKEFGQPSRLSNKCIVNGITVAKDQ